MTSNFKIGEVLARTMRIKAVVENAQAEKIEGLPPEEFFNSFPQRAQRRNWPGARSRSRHSARQFVQVSQISGGLSAWPIVESILAGNYSDFLKSGRNWP